MARSSNLRWGWSVLGVTLLAASVSAQPDVALVSLTVPPAALPEGCALAQTAAPRVPSNPWSGSAPELMEFIWPAVLPPVPGKPLPDGFPRDQREALAWRANAWEAKLARARGLSEAYQARYVTPYGGSAVVSAVRYTDPRRAAESAVVPFIEQARPTRFLWGSIVASISGTRESPCFEAVRSHVQRILR